jgi:hypothetical protein
LDFISNNYAPLKDGAKAYIPIDDPKLVPKLKAFFGYKDKTKVLDLITTVPLIVLVVNISSLKTKCYNIFQRVSI